VELTQPDVDGVRIVRAFPAQLGQLAEILSRRRIGVGVDARGQLVLARPDSIQVDFNGNSKRRKTVLDLVDQIDADNADVVERYDAETTGVLTVKVAAEVTELSGEPRWPLDALNIALARFSDKGVSADLNHVVFGAQSLVQRVLGGALTGSSTPASSPTTILTPENRAALMTAAEPTVAPRYLREPLDLHGHRRPRVLVLDTGLRTVTNGKENQPEHAFLRSVDPQRPFVHLHDGWETNPDVEALDDEDEPDDDHSGLLDFEAGHGTFITGIVRQICPDAEIFPAGVLSSFGEGSVARVRSAVRRMAKSCGPFDIVVMSFGTYCANDDPGLFGARLPELVGDGIAVAAAGNLQSCRPYFPAALPGVIGVGGLDRGGPAWFSNFGSWVDACAPAVNVVSTFFNDITETVKGRPRRRFREWARWSGTSFAAPKVAGAIAQEMYVNQVSATEAWQRLSSTDRLRMPDLGIVFNI
jgi:Subtilase family